MQRAGGDINGGEGREERDNKMSGGSDDPAEDGATSPFAQLNNSQDGSGPTPDDLTPRLHPDHSGANEHCTAAPDPGHVDQVDLTPQEDMEDEEPLLEEEEEEEEEELIVLDSEHPLVRRLQAALSSQLKKKVEKINLDLKEKRSLEKSDDDHMKEMYVETFRIQEQLAILHTRLEAHHHTKAQAETKHRKAQDQLEAMKSQYTSVTRRHNQAKANVSELQTELDNLKEHLIYTQGFGEDLHSKAKATQNVKHKAGAKKNQAEEEKLKQDFYLERLTKTMERLTQQIAMYEVQTGAQAEETRAAQEALSEAEMERESLLVSCKNLQQQWSRNLVEMGKRDKAFSAMQEAVRAVNQQLILLDREIEGYKRSTMEEQEKHETLTMQMNWSQMDCATFNKRIGQKQADQEALQVQYSSCLHALRETEDTRARLSKEVVTHQTQANDQRRQLERESALRLELEDKIMTCMRQALTHKLDVKYSQSSIDKITRLKKEKMFQLWQMENDIGVGGLESRKVEQHLNSLAFTQEALNKEVTQRNELLTSAQAKTSSLFTLIEQKQHTIASYKTKIDQIAASNACEDFSHLKIKVHALIAQIEELEGKIKRDKQLWMKTQGTLVGMTQEIEANSKSTLRLQTEYTGMRQKKIRLESQTEEEHREEKELEKNAKALRGDLLKLNTLLSRKGQLSLALEQENALMETDFLHTLKEAERGCIELQSKLEKTQDEKERLVNSLVEAERHIMLWEKKVQLLKETRSTVDSGEEEMQAMKAEIHRMEKRLDQLMRQRELLLRESEATVARRERIDLRREAMKAGSSHGQTSKGELNAIIRGVQRRIQETHKNVVEGEQVIRELQENQVTVKDRLAEQKRRLMELCGTGSVLDCEIVQLRDTKHRNLAHLVALQSRTKRLQAVCGGSYQAASTSQSVGSLLQRQVERVHAVGSILHRVCEEFPQHQGALRRPLLSLETCMQALELEPLES